MNILKFIITTGITLLLFGFTTPEKASTNHIGDFIKIELPASEVTLQDGWGRWHETSCYKGLDYRVKNKGQASDGRYKWGVQFQNRYYEKIYFSYEVYDSRPYNPRSTNRTDLQPDEISSGYRDFYMNSGNSIYVYVDNVRFGRDGLQDYYSCDK